MLLRSGESGKGKGDGVGTSGAVNQTEVRDILEGVENTNLKEPRYVGRKISNSTYKKLRNKTPSQEIKDKINENIDFPIHEDRVLPGKIGDIDVLEADHIVPMNSITQMEGFEKLTFEQQLEVLNYEENFVGLSKSANTSKQSKSYSEWTHYKKGTSEEIEVDKTFRNEMIQKEKILEKKLQKMIDDFVKQNKGEI